MGEFSPLHWMVVLAVIVLFFGGKRIPEMMRGLGEGVKSFKEGMREDPKPAPPASTTTPAATTNPETK